MRCKVCNANINTTFLEKVIGTWMRDNNSKKQIVCFECQKAYAGKQAELKQKISE